MFAARGTKFAVHAKTVKDVIKLDENSKKTGIISNINFGIILKEQPNVKLIFYISRYYYF